MQAASPRHVPSPDDTPQFTARQLLRRIRREGGRVYRMQEAYVFAITSNEQLADWLMDSGGRAFQPSNASELPHGAFRMHKGGAPHWDIYIHLIPVRGEQTLWEAAGDLGAEPYEVGDTLPYEADA